MNQLTNKVLVQSFKAEVTSETFDYVLALHAWRAGQFLLMLDKDTCPPSVVILGGAFSHGCLALTSCNRYGCERDAAVRSGREIDELCLR